MTLALGLDALQIDPSSNEIKIMKIGVTMSFIGPIFVEATTVTDVKGYAPIQLNIIKYVN